MYCLLYTSTFYRPWGNSALQFAWSWKLSCTCLCQGSWWHAARRSEASDRQKKHKSSSEMNVLDQDKICNTMVATSMAKAMRQHVGRKSSILDVSRFALKWPPLYHMSCPGQKRSFAFFCPSLAVVLWISGLQKIWLQVLWNSRCSIELRQACAIMAPASS